MTPKDWIEDATRQLTEAGVSSPRLDAQLLVEYATGRDRASLSIDESTELDIKILNKQLERRIRREPLAYILGSREFYGLDFIVSESVLVPRPETEVMVEKAINEAPESSSVLELGTGSGCISIALSKNRPDLSILATDVSFDALGVAQKNNEEHKTNVKFHHSDLFKSLRGTYDVILANLPYVPEPARRQPEITHEPDVALYGGEDGLDYYRTFFAEVSDYLEDQGFMIVEFSPTQFAAARSEFSDFTFEPLSEYIYFVEPN